MSEEGSDHDERRATTQHAENSNETELSTDGAISLFTSALNNALEKQKHSLINHFEARLGKSVKATGVDQPEFVFHSEGIKVQYSFNTERLERLAAVESCIKLGNASEVSEIISQEKEIIRKRNKILKIADKHGWDTVKEYLDSPLADNKEDASDLRAAISRASRKRSSKPYSKPESSNSGSRKGEFNSRSFFFVALAKSVIPSSPKQASQKVTSVSIVTSPGTLQGTAPKKGFLQRQLVQQSSRNRTQERPSNKTDTDIDEVEYCFQFVNKYEKKSGQNLINVKGNLRKHALFWKNVLNANDFIMNVINFGYRIPFLSEPPTIFLSNNRSALKHSEFVENSIEELLTKECIKEVNRPFVVNPLTVSVNSTGKERLVLDLRHVNKFVEKQKVKFEGVKEAMTFVNFSGFGFKFDLKSGYHHIEIHPDHQKYLGFSWQYGDTVRYFTFSVLPFGLSSAGHIFTKTVRVLVKYWRSLGFPMVVYLDDGMGTAENFDTCFELSKTVKNDLLLSGFIANTEKSVWEPVQNIDWLGFVWNFTLYFRNIA
ncbi:uncharacterized protein LOC134705325 [Mytilus trossulus]|uniref:uncharacterized protein LOC134705325 n=1 Tax=Mytilus trossulus TaxID=6551 RepID=UPI003004B675